MRLAHPALQSARPTARCLRPRPRALPRGAVSMTDTVDKAQYDSRWEGMWGGGLEPGTVRTAHNWTVSRSFVSSRVSRIPRFLCPRRRAAVLTLGEPPTGVRRGQALRGAGGRAEDQRRGQLRQARLRSRLRVRARPDTFATGVHCTPGALTTAYTLVRLYTRRGYDLVALLNAGCAETVGLEISPTAASAATDYLKSQGLEAPRAAVQQGDFFKDDVGTFDLGYDYTCVL